MAAAPMNNNSEPTSDLQLAIVEWKPPILPGPIVTIAQLPPSKTSPLAPLTPSSELSGERKRKRLKPERLELSSIYVEKKRSFSKDKAVHDASRRRSCLGKENATKGSKAPVKISQAMIRAREVQSTLGNEYPTFIKTMLGSHVTSCFWMGLPFRFGRSFYRRKTV